jgi:hypothetical protein
MCERRIPVKELAFPRCATIPMLGCSAPRCLEHLCRYACRPAIAESRLTLLPDGRVGYALKRRWQDGTVAVVMEPQVLMERLRALVPSRGGTW